MAYRNMNNPTIKQLYNDLTIPDPIFVDTQEAACNRAMIDIMRSHERSRESMTYYDKRAYYNRGKTNGAQI